MQLPKSNPFTSLIRSLFWEKRHIVEAANAPSDQAQPVRMERQKRLQKGSLILLSHPHFSSPAAYRVTEVDVSSRIVKFRAENEPENREYFAHLGRGEDTLEGDIRVYRSYAVFSNQFRSIERRKVLGTYSPRSGLQA